MKIYQAGCGCLFVPLSPMPIEEGVEYIAINSCDAEDGLGIRVEKGRISARNLANAVPISDERRAQILEQLCNLIHMGKKFRDLKQILE